MKKATAAFPWDRMTACSACGRPVEICVCDRTQPLATRLRVLVLQHPQEKRQPLASTPLLMASLPKAVLRVGLSWRSLDAALKEVVDAKRWAVAFPYDATTAVSRADGEAECAVLDRHGEIVDPCHLEGVIVLDGTWSQAKTLWWRNAWLLKLPRMVLFPRAPSIYGGLRPEPRRQYLSTLEAAALALDACGEPAETGRSLRRVFRTLVQRARDAMADSRRRAR